MKNWTKIKLLKITTEDLTNAKNINNLTKSKELNNQKSTKSKKADFAKDSSFKIVLLFCELICIY